MHDYSQLANDIRHWGRDLGFADVGISGVQLGDDERYLDQWLAENQHGEMHYMAAHGSKRARPAELIPGTVRVISVRMDYGTGDDAGAWQTLNDPTQAYVARYALGRDYHKVLRARLQKLSDRIQSEISPLAIGYLSIPRPCLNERCHETPDLAGSEKIPV